VVFRGDTELVVVSVVYLLLAAFLLVRNRRIVLPVLRDGFRTPYSELAAKEAVDERQAIPRSGLDPTEPAGEPKG
jgi:hypothetical protein